MIASFEKNPARKGVPVRARLPRVKQEEVKAVKRVVRAPKHKQRVKAVWLFSIRGLIRIRRKIPATTIVLECSRAETGVGPSMAEGSHGWRPNWADLPVA